ncbi:MAG: hypothetical protein JNG85_01375 [Spirochaetaceae bacterium]|nr:hypothetical protein [Spirochaetaceae bacterium]
MPNDPTDPGSPRVVAADDSIVAVYKPPRCHSAPLAEGELSLAAWVFERFPDAALRGEPAAAGRLGREGGLLHRLDYETSGLVLFARSRAALDFLLAEQEGGRVRKDYLLLAMPVPGGLEGSRPRLGTVDGVAAGRWEAAIRVAFSAESAMEALEPLAACLPPGGEASVACRFRPFGPGAARVACLHPEADLPAKKPRRGSPERVYETLLRGLGPAAPVGAPRRLPPPFDGLEFPDRPVLALEASLRRGFRHQIRAQLAWLGLPLVGDEAYGGAHAERLCLHAARLEFLHPATGETTVLEV